MRTRRRGPGRGFAAIAGATAVLAGCLATGPLFLSTTGTAATRVDLSARCAGLVAANFTGPYESRAEIVSTFDGLAGRVPEALAPVVTTISSVGMTPVGDRTFRSAVVGHRTDGVARLDISARAGTEGVYEPDWFAAEEAVRPGQVLELQPARGPVEHVPVIGVYRSDAAARPDAYWCAFTNAFQTDQYGGHKPPVLILDDRGAARYAALFAQGRVTWELPLAARPTASGTAAYLAHLAPLRDAGDTLSTHSFGGGSVFFNGGAFGQVLTDIQFVVQRARAVRSVTGADIAPVRWSGALTGIALVFAAALLFVRRNRNEYRIRILRGARPLVLAVQAAGRTVPAVVGGALAGAIVAGILIRTFGPSSDLDRAAFVSAVRFTVLAVAATLFAVVLTVAIATRAFDRSRARVRSRGRLRWVPFELVGAAISWVAFRHLARTGGVNLMAADTSHVDPWAVLFPLLLTWSVLVALARPLFALLRRARTRTFATGARPSVMLGVRRAVADPIVGVVTTGAVAFCLVTFVYASTLATSMEASLQTKAHTFVGADLRVSLTHAPRLAPAIAEHATLATRGQGSYAGARVTVIGVDRATFARVAFWRRSFGSGSLDTLLASIRPPASGPLPVLIAGAAQPGAGSGPLAIDEGGSTRARVVARIPLWPSIQPFDTFVIADGAALARRGLIGVDEVWVKGLPDLAPDQLASPGAGVLYSVDLQSVFDYADTLPVRWSLGLLGALGAVAGVAFAAVELAIVDARARARQLAYLLWHRMGLRPRQHRVACALELGIPAVFGAAAAFVAALVTVRIAIGHLDPLTSLPPRPGFVLTARPLLIGACVVLAVLALLVGWSQRVSRSGDPLELIRVAE